MSAIQDRYLRQTSLSAQAAERAKRVMPGGDTRAAAHHLPYPVTIARGEGPYVWDIDGHRYTDLAGNFTSLVHGHAFPPIVAELRRATEFGTAWAANCETQIELAELLCARVDSVEQLRFCNSGTEAGMLAAQIARHATGRPDILMARYGYHGFHEDFETGTFGRAVGRTRLATYGDVDDFRQALSDGGSQIAAVFVEPVMGAAGIVSPPLGFLRQLEGLAHDAGALLVADEVISFRLAEGGAQRLFGFRPDLTMFGKIIGGGLPVGAVGGRADLMVLLDSYQGPRIHHSGTFNGNPLTTSAGIISVQQLTSSKIENMARLAAALRAGLEKSAAHVGLPFSVNQCGSLLNIFFCAEPPPAALVRPDQQLMTAFHLASMNRGLFFPSRGLLALSTVFTDDVVEETIAQGQLAMADVMDEIGGMSGPPGLAEVSDDTGDRDARRAHGRECAS
ncbi:MAG: aspartate aminotransferase family protein [Streptosporangiaceae bacterium]